MHGLTVNREDILRLLKQALEQHCSQEVVGRLQWFMHFAEHKSVSETCRHFRIARSTFYRWLRRFDPNDLSTLKDLPPHTEVVCRRATPAPSKAQEKPQHHAKEIAPAQVHTCPFCRFCTWMQPLWKRCGRLTVLLSIFLNLAFILSLLLPRSAGASSWSPTLLVNTESFQIIDDSDVDADVYIQFGDSLSKKLTFERTLDRFNFNDDVYIGGNLGVFGTASGAVVHAQNTLTSSGTLTVSGNAEIRGTLSGAALTASSLRNCNTIDTNAAGELVCGSDEGGTGGVTQDAADARYVNVSGDTMTGALTVQTSQANDSGALLLNQDSNGTGMLLDSEATNAPGIAIDMASDDTQVHNAPHLLFGYKGIFDTNLFRKAANILRTDDSFHVGATLSGAALTVSSLRNCNTIDTNAAGELVCGTDDGGAGGLTQDAADARYVNVAGDTMTGSLTIANNGVLNVSGAILTNSNLTINSDNAAADAVLTFGNDAAAETLRFNDSTNEFVFSDDVSVQGTLSGASLKAGGGQISFSTGGTAIFNVNNLAVNFRIASDDQTNLFFVHGTNNRIGINTSEPEADLDVIGTISGSALRVSNLSTSGALVYSSGSSLRNTAAGASGTVLVSQGSQAPQWFTPVGGMVWYLDGTLAVGTSKGAKVRMPFGVTLSSVMMDINGAPTGTGVVVDVKKDGVSIFSAKPVIAAGATTGGSNAVFSDTNLPTDAVMTLDVTTVGSTFAGSGLTLNLRGIRKY